ncbi:MAG: hypothetical protein WEB58_12545 [Planctomycetaceae bacterium]
MTSENNATSGSPVRPCHPPKQGSEQLTDLEREDAGLVGAKKKKGTAVRGTKGWDDTMVKAKGQAEQYARALPAEEGWPPFLIVVDALVEFHCRLELS